MDLEQRIVAALRLEEAFKVDEDRGWQLWRYRLRDPASQTQLPQELFFLFIRSRGLIKADLPKLASRIRDVARNAKTSVAIQRSSPLANDLDLVKQELKVSSVKLLSDLLQQEARHLLGGSHPDLDANPYFVEPVVDDGPALTKLGRWLAGEWDASHPENDTSVGVLLAPAGVGKTSVARELARSLRTRAKHDVFPLLIESGQWSTLNPNEPPSLWSLIKHALERSGHESISQQTFELFAKAGYIVTIFDGLDEVGSIRGGTLTPVDVIAQLRILAEESDCRVLLTSREGLWSEMVPAELQSKIREFRLRPFRNEQIARYREKRFPNPRAPERERFDQILRAVTDAAHPQGVARTAFEERAPSAPLILHLVATEAEAYKDGAAEYGLDSSQYREPLYAITFGILHREHRLRNLSLTPSQQFMMISTLIVDIGVGPYTFRDVRDAADYASGSQLDEGQAAALRSHPLLRRDASGLFTFRFEYLAQFAPAVWLCDYILSGIQNATVEKYLGSIAGRSSPVSAYVAELLSHRDWRMAVSTHVKRVKSGDASQRDVAPFFWEVAQSLLPGPGGMARSARTDFMCELFGERIGNKILFSSLSFTGPIVYMDFRGTAFRGCSFQNCEWINCEITSDTEFASCTYKGRFAAVQTSGLRTAIYNPLTEDNTDADARIEFEALLQRAGGLTTNLDAITGMLIGLLQPFRASGFFAPRTRDQITARYVGPAPVRDFIIEQLMEHGVLEQEEGRGLSVIKKNGAAVLALLDNGTLNGAVRTVANSVAERFKN